MTKRPEAPVIANAFDELATRRNPPRGSEAVWNEALRLSTDPPDEVLTSERPGRSRPAITVLAAAAVLVIVGAGTAWFVARGDQGSEQVSAGGGRSSSSPGSFDSQMPVAIRVDRTGTAWFLTEDHPTGALTVRAQDATGWSATYKVGGGPNPDSHPTLLAGGEWMILAYDRCPSPDCASHTSRLQPLKRAGNEIATDGSPWVSGPQRDSPDAPRLIGTTNTTATVSTGRRVVSVRRSGDSKASTLPPGAGDPCVVKGRVVAVVGTVSAVGSIPTAGQGGEVTAQTPEDVEEHLVTLTDDGRWQGTGSTLPLDTTTMHPFRCMPTGLELAEPDQLALAIWDGSAWTQHDPKTVPWQIAGNSDGLGLVGVQGGRIVRLNSSTGRVERAVTAPAALATRWSAGPGAMNSALPGPITDPVAIGGPASSPTAATCYLDTKREPNATAHCLLFQNSDSASAVPRKCVPTAIVAKSPSAPAKRVLLDRPRVKVTLHVGGVIRLVGPKCLPPWSAARTPIVLRPSSDGRRYVAIETGSIDVIVLGRWPGPPPPGADNLKTYTHLVVTVVS